MKKSWFEMWNSKELPEELQKEIDFFAEACHGSNLETSFRAGFHIGFYLRKIKKDYKELFDDEE